MSTVAPKFESVQVREPQEGNEKTPSVHDEGEAPLDGSHHPTTYRADRGGGFPFGGRMKHVKGHLHRFRRIRCHDAKGPYLYLVCSCGYSKVKPLPSGAYDTPRPREAVR